MRAADRQVGCLTRSRSVPAPAPVSRGGPRGRSSVADEISCLCRKRRSFQLFSQIEGGRKEGREGRVGSASVRRFPLPPPSPLKLNKPANAALTNGGTTPAQRFTVSRNFSLGGMKSKLRSDCKVFHTGLHSLTHSILVQLLDQLRY